jgi:hypothetical protein
LYEIAVYPQAAFSQRATWPPSAAVRQRSMALITFICVRLTWPRLASRVMPEACEARRGTVVAEDIRDLQSGTGHRRRRLWRDLPLASLDLAGALLGSPRPL